MYKKSLPKYVEMRKGGVASGAMHSGATSEAVSSTANSAPENVIENSHRSSNKLKMSDIELAKSTGSGLQSR